MLVGIVRPTAGRASIAGFDVFADAREALRHVGYVPENIPLYDSMRVHEFLRTMAAIKGIPTRAVRAAIAQVTDQLSLEKVSRKTIRSLSRGFRQRVAIAQALLTKPALLVLDEPTNGLDPRQIIECRELIQDLSSDCAVLVTSHILGEIERIADRVAILLDGRLLSVEPMTSPQGEKLDLEARFLALTSPP